MKTVVGLYDDVEDARQVIDDLMDAGIRANDINMVAGDPERRYATQLPGEDYEAGDGAVDGAVAGGVLGGLTGLLVGVGALALPGLGPIVVAGPLISGLVGAGVGAAGGGLIGALVSWGVSEEEAEFYLEGVRRGGTLVAVRTPEEEVDAVAAIMDRHGLVDLEARAADWREAGWTGYDPDAYADLEFDTYDSAFREHYEEHYETQFPYTTYSPAYRFGYFLSMHDRFHDAEWEEMEPEARRIWEEQYDEDWDEYSDAVAFGVYRARRTSY